MKKYLLVAVALTTIGTSANARDHSPYVGVEGGILFPKHLNGDAFVDFTTIEVARTATNVVLRAGPEDFAFANAFDSEVKPGHDIDAILGYDFGMFRLEGEFGYKRSKRKGFDPSSAFLATLNAGLNRPAGIGDDPILGNGDPIVPGQPALTANDFEKFDGKIGLRSAMANALFDFGHDDGVSFYAGGGVGRVWARAFNDKDQAWAWQLIAGARYSVSRNVDVGLKYRFFRTTGLNFEGGPVGFGGNADRSGDYRFFVHQQTSALIYPQMRGRFESHSLLASLTLNFGRAELLPLIVSPLPPPGPASPPAATVTCPNGAVILTTDSCPLPPPPAPPAPPAPERG